MGMLDRPTRKVAAVGLALTCFVGAWQVGINLGTSEPARSFGIAGIIILLAFSVGCLIWGFRKGRDNSRILLQRLAHELVTRFDDIRNARFSPADLMKAYAAETAFRDQLLKLNDAILSPEIDLKIAAKYSDHIARIRTILNKPGHPFDKINALAAPVNEIYQIQRPDHKWDLERSGLLTGEDSEARKK